MRVTIKLDENFCKGCMLCVEFCPKDVFESTDRLNQKGYFLPRVAHPDRCTGCMLCEHLCPDMAIEVVVERVSHRP